jgi:hypothetical protein
MTISMKYEIINGDNWFKIIYSRRSNKDLDTFLTFNPDNYYIMKATGRQKLVSYKDFLEFKNAGYIFFHKDFYDIGIILEWINYKNLVISYLSRAVPPFSPAKIIIKK